ncbi:MAG: DUF1858 domain-containing protein [Clostridiales bacterium]|jgi:selenophosphate synthetase-related protein|nr:DUF1858 domain-containing protein [Clostridiales bacterium]
MGNKVVDLSKTVYELCSTNPEIIDILIELGFKDIAKPGMLQTAGRIMTLSKGAAMKKIDLNTIKETFKNHGYEIAE